MTIDLDKLYRIALENVALLKEWRKRFLYFDVKKRMESSISISESKKEVILISGIRGVGKTTLMLQLFQEEKNAFYFSADAIVIKSTTLYAVVEQIYRTGHRTVFIDEIHKYPTWVEELKNIYDDFTIQVIASGSSVASLRKGAITLGRRAVDFPLSPLTFGEFFYLREGQQYTAQLEDALDKKKVMKWLVEHPSVEKYSQEYYSIGGFPLKIEEKGAIFHLVKQMIYEDAVAEFSLTKNKVDIIDRLLAFLALSEPGEFSYTSFSSMSGYSKSTIYEAIHMLKELGLIIIIEGENPKAKAKATIKILFAHPNLRIAFADQLLQEAKKGALREEYFIFHMIQLGFPLWIPKTMKKSPDYEVRIKNRKLLFEIGGTAKTKSQLEGRDGVVLQDEHLLVLGFVQKNVQK